MMTLETLFATAAIYENFLSAVVAKMEIGHETSFAIFDSFFGCKFNFLNVLYLQSFYNDQDKDHIKPRIDGILINFQTHTKKDLATATTF